MRAYLVGVSGLPPEEVACRVVVLAGTQAAASAVWRDLMAQHNLKRNQVVREEVEVPTAKADLLAYVNSLLAFSRGELDVLPDPPGR